MEPIIGKIKDILLKRSSIDAVLLTGSYSRNEAYRDIDLLALITGSSEDGFIKKMVEDLRKMSILPVLFDDAIQFSLSGVSVSIAIRQSRLFSEYIRGFISGENTEAVPKAWAFGGRLPEAVCSDLITGSILFDPRLLLKGLRDGLDPYPPSARTALLAKYSEEIRFKLGFLESGQDHLSSAIGNGEIILSLVRVMFAHRKRFIPGTKRIVEYIRAHLTSEESRLADLILEKGSITDALVAQKIRKYIDKIEKEVVSCIGQTN